MKFEMILDRNVVPSFRDAGIDGEPFWAIPDRGPFPASVICPCKFGDENLDIRLKVFSRHPWAHIEFDVDNASIGKMMRKKFFRYSTEDKSSDTYKSWKVREITKGILKRDGLTIEDVCYRKSVMPRRCIDAVMRHHKETKEPKLKRDTIFLFEKDLLAKEDQVFVARWLIKHLAEAKGYHDGCHLIEQLYNGDLALPEVADDLIRMLTDRRCGARDACLFDIFVKTKDRRVLDVAVSVLGDVKLASEALRCIGRRKAKQHVEKVRPLLKHRNNDIRRQAKKTMKQLGFPVETPPAPIHLVKKRSGLAKDLEEWSSNLDIEQLRPTLTKVAKHVEDGFGSQEIAEIEGVVEEMKEEQTRMFRFPITFGGKKTDLWLIIFMDDVDSPDLEIYSSSELIKKLSRLLK